MAQFKSKHTGAQIDNGVDKAILAYQMTQSTATYAELETAKTNNELVAGAQYLLSDYVTKYRQPYTNIIKETLLDGGINERLILTAVSRNQFDVVCSSLDYPDDIVYYDFNDKICEDDITPRKGFIQYRIDVKNNYSATHDWRTMLWSRFKATATVWASGSILAGNIYQVGTNLYMAIRSGTPLNETDTTYFKLICTVNDYLWSGAAGLAGLKLDKVDYAERYQNNGSISLTVQTPTKHATITPKNICISSGSDKANTALKGLSDTVFMFSSIANFPQRINILLGAYSNTIRHLSKDITIEQGTYGTILSGTQINIGKNNLNTIVVSGVGITTGENNNNIILFAGNASINIGNGNRYVYSENCQKVRIGNGNDNIVIDNKSLGLEIGNANYDIFIGYNSIGNTIENNVRSVVLGAGSLSNYFENETGNIITDTGFSYNRIERGVHDKNLSAVSSLHNKEYGSRIFMTSDYKVFSEHFEGTNPIFTALT